MQGEARDRRRHRGASMRPGRYRPGCAGGRWPEREVKRCFNEAGAISPRMLRGEATIPPAAACASMRPGRYRPGCVRGRRHGLDVGTRFNEAGAISPRMPPRTGTGHRDRLRFNEAGAISPRMHRLQTPAITTADVRFNEAGAISPRMHAARQTAQTEYLASMRPGRYRPGCSDRHSTVLTMFEPLQ